MKSRINKKLFLIILLQLMHTTLENGLYFQNIYQSLEWILIFHGNGDDITNFEQYYPIDIPLIPVKTQIRSAVITEGNILVTGNYNGEIRLIDLNNSTIMSIINKIQNLFVRAIILVQPDKFIYTVSGKFYQVDLKDQRRTLLFQQTPELWNIRIDKKSKRIHIASSQKNIQIFDLETNQNKRFAQIESESKQILCDNQGKVYLALDNGNVIIYNETTGDVIYSLKAHTKSITDIALSSVKTQLITSSTENSIKFWDIRNGYHLIKTINPSTLPTTQVSRIILILNDSILVSSIKSPNIIQFWSMKTYEELKHLRLEGFKDWIPCIDYIESLEILVIGSIDAQIRILDLMGFQQIYSIEERYKQWNPFSFESANQVICQNNATTDERYYPTISQRKIKLNMTLEFGVHQLIKLTAIVGSNLASLEGFRVQLLTCLEFNISQVSFNLTCNSKLQIKNSISLNKLKELFLS